MTELPNPVKRPPNGGSVMPGQRLPHRPVDAVAHGDRLADPGQLEDRATAGAGETSASILPSPRITRWAATIICKAPSQ
ncbi:MAG: hypothetical protein ACRDP7_48470 [Trebonia sp.]